MKWLNYKKLAGLAALGFVLAIGSATVNAQDWNRIEKERQRIYKQQQKLAKKNAKLEQARRQRSYDHGRYDTPVYDNGYGRIGSSQGSVNSGYEQGLKAGQYDRGRGKYNLSNVYRSSPVGGDPTRSDYLFRQGYLQGYQDGWNGRLSY